MSEKIISTRPVDENEKLLQKKFYEDLAKQGERVDALSAQLLTLELAIPGVYASVLKLISGDEAILQNRAAIWWAFGLWGIAIALTLVALLPKKWQVDTRVFKQDRSLIKEKGLGIEDYFYQAARYKWNFALASILLFFAGIVAAVFTI